MERMEKGGILVEFLTIYIHDLQQYSLSGGRNLLAYGGFRIFWLK